MFDQTEIGLKASMGQYSTGQLATGDGIKSLSFLGPQKSDSSTREHDLPIRLWQHPRKNNRLACSHGRLLHRRTYSIPIEHTLLPSRHRNDRCLRCHLYPRSSGHAYSTIEVFMALPRSAGLNRHCLLHVQCLRSREPWATRAKLRSKRRIRCTHHGLRHRDTLRYRFCQAVEEERIDHPRTTRSLPSHTLRDLTLFWQPNRHPDPWYAGPVTKVQATSRVS